MERDAFEIRPPRPEDLNCIIATFMDSMKDESKLGKSCSSEIFYKGFQRVVDHLLETSEILVACSAENSNTILGYIIFEPGIVHYVFVKWAFRHLEIAKDLVKRAIPDQDKIRFPLKTNSADQICNKYPELIYDPFILFKQGAENGNAF